MRHIGTTTVLFLASLAGCDVFLDCDPAEQESVQEGTDITWLRCPVGQCWSGHQCTGTQRLFSWEEAMEACPPRWRLPTRDEFVGLLGECESDTADDTAEMCPPCAQECNGLFELYDDDNGYYWSSTEADETAWAVFFNTGAADFEGKEGEHWARCVR